MLALPDERPGPLTQESIPLPPSGSARDLNIRECTGASSATDNGALTNADRATPPPTGRSAEPLTAADGSPAGRISIVGQHRRQAVYARLTGSGPQWSRQAADQMLVVRGAVMAKDFDLLWEAA